MRRPLATSPSRWKWRRTPGFLAVRADLLLAQGEAELRVGDPRPARASFERVVSLIGDSDADRLARAALGHAGSRIRAWWPDIAAGNTRNVELLELALARLPEVDSTRRAEVLGALAQELHWWPQTEDRREELSAEAVAMARRLGDADTIAYVLCARNLALAGTLSAHEWMSNANESVELAEGLGDPLVYANTTAHQCFAAILLGDGAVLEKHLAITEAAFLTLKDPSGWLLTSSFRGNLAVAEGRFDEGERLIHDGFRAAQEAGDPNAFTGYGSSICMMRLWQGRIAEVTSVAEAFLSFLPGAFGVDHAIMAAVYSQLGLTEKAQSHLDQVDPTDRASLPRNGFWLGALQVLARAAFLVGDTAKAEVVGRLLEPEAGLNAIVGVSPLGAVDLGRAVAATTCGRYDEAEPLFEAALASNRGNGWRVLEVEVLVHYADMLTRRGAEGDAARAGHLIDELIPIADTIGMPWHVARAEDLRQRIGGSASPVPMAMAQHSVVTRRQRAKARIVSIGRAAVAAWTGGRSDGDLVRRFSVPLAQRALFTAVARGFQPPMAFGFDGDITFDLRPPDDDGDPGAGDWWTIEVRGRKATARPGGSAVAQVVIHAGIADFLRVAAGEMHPVKALLDNAVDVEGDIMLAARLPDMFGAVEPLEVGARAQ